MKFKDLKLGQEFSEIFDYGSKKGQPKSSVLIKNTKSTGVFLTGGTIKIGPNKEIVTKQSILKAFEQEYRDALVNERSINSQDLPNREYVINKYMEMETDQFDADDLNEIIDKIEDEDEKSRA